MNNIGITFLIAEKKSEKKYRAHLISFAFDFVSLDSLKQSINNKISEIIEKSNYVYIGIEDVFFISGGLSNGSLLGKSSLDEFDSVEKAHKLTNSIETFELKELIETENKEYIFSLIYFYINRSIACLFYFEGISFYEALKEIKKNANKNLYKAKIVLISEQEEKIDVKRLKYIGVESASNRSNHAKLFGGFESYYHDFNNMKEIENLLPDQKNIFSIIKNQI